MSSLVLRALGSDPVVAEQQDFSSDEIAPARERPSAEELESGGTTVERLGPLGGEPSASRPATELATAVDDRYELVLVSVLCAVMLVALWFLLPAVRRAPRQDNDGGESKRIP